MKHTLTIDGYPIGCYETRDPMIEHVIIEAPEPLPEPVVDTPLDFEHAPGETPEEVATAILSTRPTLFLID